MRLVLETDDKATDRHDVSRHAAWTRRGDGTDERGENVDPAEYYFRTAIAFETAAAKYDWLNRIIAIGTGRSPPEGPVYDVFEVL